MRGRMRGRGGGMEEEREGEGGRGRGREEERGRMRGREEERGRMRGREGRESEGERRTTNLGRGSPCFLSYPSASCRGTSQDLGHSPCSDLHT